MTGPGPARRALVGTLIVAAGLAGGACAPGGGSPEPASLTVFAAASLRDVLAGAAARHEAASGVPITTAFDSTAALRVQIEQGAPADVLAAADMTNPQRLVDAGLAGGPVTAFAGNRVVMITPADNPAAIAGPVDLAAPWVRIVAAGQGVPITAYAEEAIDRLAAIEGYPPDYARRLDANLVSREDNVRAVLAKVELGEADAALVYATDAGESDAVLTFELPDAAQVRVEYGAVVTAASTDAEAARGFVGWLAGPDGQMLLVDHGFVPVGARR